MVAVIAGIGLLAGRKSAAAQNPVPAPAAAAESPAPSAPASNVAAATSSTSASATSSGTVCDEDLITVNASTDAAAYAPGKEPILILRVTNAGTAPCKVNVGTSVQEFTILSGKDRIFDSKDCQTDPQDKTISLAAGASETANFPWKRNRTTPSCGPVTGVPGPGTYTLTVSLDGHTSEKYPFTLR